jgi:hypothetical protein
MSEGDGPEGSVHTIWAWGLLSLRSASACDEALLAAAGADPTGKTLGGAAILDCDPYSAGSLAYLVLTTQEPDDAALPPHRYGSSGPVPSHHLIWLERTPAGPALRSRRALGVGRSDPRQSYSASITSLGALYDPPVLVVEERTDGDGDIVSEHAVEVLQLTPEGPNDVFSLRMETSSGSDYPNHNGDFDITYTRSAFGSAPDLAIDRAVTRCPDVEQDCATEADKTFVCYVPGGWTDLPVPCPRAPTATATSTLRASGRASYDARHVLDGDTTTAWAEGAEGPGIGARLRIELGALPLTEIHVLPGYGKSAALWEANNRVRTARLHASDGSVTEVAFQDVRAPQRVALPGTAPLEWLELEIVEVYGGTRDDDTCISEIWLFGDPAR